MAAVASAFWAADTSCCAPSTTSSWRWQAVIEPCELAAVNTIPTSCALACAAATVVDATVVGRRGGRRRRRRRRGRPPGRWWSCRAPWWPARSWSSPDRCPEWWWPERSSPGSSSSCPSPDPGSSPLRTPARRSRAPAGRCRAWRRRPAGRRGPPAGRPAARRRSGRSSPCRRWSSGPRPRRGALRSERPCRGWWRRSGWPTPARTARSARPWRGDALAVEGALQHQLGLVEGRLLLADVHLERGRVERGKGLPGGHRVTDGDVDGGDGAGDGERDRGPVDRLHRAHAGEALGEVLCRHGRGAVAAGTRRAGHDHGDRCARHQADGRHRDRRVGASAAAEGGREEERRRRRRRGR